MTLEEGIHGDLMGLDIGPLSTKLFADAVASSGTIVWNGFEAHPLFIVAS